MPPIMLGEYNTPLISLMWRRSFITSNARRSRGNKKIFTQLCVLVEFQVEALSRVRHPNVVTLMGTCPESRSLIYEYLQNGSLEDCLSCKGNTPALSWQTRTQIAIEICSALIFLHCSRPSIVHGNLKPTKVLLGAHYVSKLSDLGIFGLVKQDKNSINTTTPYNITNPKVISVYTDPEFVESGELTPQSDVYSFGIILLRLITGRPTFGVVKDVKCALEKGTLNLVLDISAGDWPLEQAKQLAYLALKCCEKNRFDRPDLVSEVWSVLEPMKSPHVASASYMNTQEQCRVPSHFVCPIFQVKIMHSALKIFCIGWLPFIFIIISNFLYISQNVITKRYSFHFPPKKENDIDIKKYHAFSN